MRVDWRPEAVREIEEAATWYQRQGPGLRDQLLAAAARVIQRIAEKPYQSRVVYRDTRRAFLRRFPFRIYYRIEGDRILVVAFLHARRDPGTWQIREPFPAGQGQRASAREENQNLRTCLS